MDVRGTTKNTMDRINEPVRKWGMSSVSLVMVVFGFMVGVFIFYLIVGVYAIIFLLLYVVVTVKVSAWLMENQKKGLSSPFADQIEYLSLDKYYEQNLDHKKIYEKK